MTGQYTSLADEFDRSRIAVAGLLRWLVSAAFGRCGWTESF